MQATQLDEDQESATATELEDEPVEAEVSPTVAELEDLDLERALSQFIKDEYPDEDAGQTAETDAPQELPRASASPRRPELVWQLAPDEKTRKLERGVALPQCELLDAAWCCEKAAQQGSTRLLRLEEAGDPAPAGPRTTPRGGLSGGGTKQEAHSETLGPGSPRLTGGEACRGPRPAGEYGQYGEYGKSSTCP